MKYIDLIKNIKQPIFSLQDLRLLHLQIYPYQLSQWFKRGDLIKLKNGLYALVEKSEQLKIETIAFHMYQPSYISLEWALAKYGLIPEITYNCTSVTAKTTRNFKNKFGNFIFRHLKKELFFGYNKIEENGQVYLIAEPEKALIDYIYLNSSKIKTQNDIDELRLNEFELRNLNVKKIKKYALVTNDSGVLKVLKLMKL